MLASTMQHSTHNHTPTHNDHHHTDKQCVRRPEPGAAQKTHPTNRCPLRTQQCAKPRSPKTPTTMNRSLCSTQPHPQPEDHGAELVKGEPATFRVTSQPHHTVRLLRKEVIQPHLPVRLPCYDFVPIASPTFDNSLPQGVRPSASGVTNFRDVTGGVYKARERIHRSVADLRLLATPTSRGRVADPDPN